MNTNKKNADDRMPTSKTSRGMEIERELEMRLELALSEVCYHGID